MYSAFQLARKYVRYYLSSSNGRGHGVHSPFVFEFIKFVLNDDKQYPFYKAVENTRRSLLRNETVISIEDFGAGSSTLKHNSRPVKKIAASSLKQRKFSQLIARIAKFYHCETIVELGTSFGITTASMAIAVPSSTVYSLEGAKEIAGIARGNFSALGLANVKLVEGIFDETLPGLLAKIPVIDLAFVDGNHRLEPTLRYFKMMLEHSKPASILIFDDIHWSMEMEEAWEAIKADNQVTLTIDLFFIGIVFLDPRFMSKQHFKVRF